MRRTEKNLLVGPSSHVLKTLALIKAELPALASDKAALLPALTFGLAKVLLLY